MHPYTVGRTSETMPTANNPPRTNPHGKASITRAFANSSGVRPVCEVESYSNEPVHVHHQTRKIPSDELCQQKWSLSRLLRTIFIG